ncbi:uncharacterized protein LOC143279789 isoform X2 [Babylonia areolata]|uniref:uncharacterized protein LOC143279789 isoform X2 n=1 Tax=Babylonia areolata TaxID=304850 RepID=UPI003FD3F0AA
MKTKMSGESKSQMSEMKRRLKIMVASPQLLDKMIQYFERHGKMLDRQDTSVSELSSFISCIRFNGVPILPPVMTGSKVKEVRQDRHSAVMKERQLQVRQREHLVERAQSLLENAEAGQAPDARSGRSAGSRLPLERPPVLKPVVTTAWGSVTASGGSTASGHSQDSVSAMGPSSLANTFATAELGQEEFGQTLDSVCSDFMSLEDTLPTDFNGVPLTSVKQQKISHDLLRLSKILKVRDMNSTGGSDISDLPYSEYAGQPELEEQGKRSNLSVLDNVSASFCHDSQDTVVEATSENVTENNVAENTSGFMDNSTDGSPAELSSQGEGNSANTSGMSSANTTSTTDSHRSNRSSPRFLKNTTVHFASFVTEYIDTSASLSSENITVVKKKLPGDKQAKDKTEAKGTAGPALNVPVNKEAGQDLLSNVSLTEPDSPLTPTPPSLHPNLPFQSYVKTDPSSSDKENDSGQSNKLSGGTDSLSGSSEPSVCPKSDGAGTTKSGQSTGVSDSQGSCKSDATATTSESSNSTLIEDVAAAPSASQDSTSALPLNIVEGEERSKFHRDSHRRSGATGPHKPKRLPPEPPQEPHQQQSARQDKCAEKDVAGRRKDSSDGSSVKGHIRRGSYTLVEPSPALLRAQAVGRREEVEDKTQRREGSHKDSEDRSKPLNIPVKSSVPSDPEAAGKAEHINKYLSQVQLHNSEDLTASQLSADLSQYDPATSAHLQSSFGILQSLASSNRSLGSGTGAGGGEVLHKFQSLQQNLLEQQQKELEELFIQQRREQMLLQEEIDEHQARMKEQQEFLASNAPENVKVPSQMHDGELSPDSNAGSSTHPKQFTFPSPKGSHLSHHGQAAGLPSQGPLLLNSSASSSSPKVRRPVLRSPVKFYPGRRPTGQVKVPPEAYEPEMRVKFDKLTAAGKGFLCRRLLLSDKVQELVKTIKDTREFAFSFQSETPIRQGNFSNQDRTLLERIVAQLQAALLDVHEIFFDTPVAEQMSLIEQTRLNSRERRLKLSTEEVVRSSAPRISTATLKAQERRRRAQEAESAVFGSSLTRPRTAPSSTTSPRSQAAADSSGPLKLQYQSLLMKAMKPAAMRAAHHHPHPSSARGDSSRSEVERPQTAPERSTFARGKRTSTTTTTSSSHAPASAHVTDTGQGKLTIRPKAPQQAGSQPATSRSTKISKSSKSWR